MPAGAQGLFSGPIHFVKGVVRVDGLPVEPLPEIAFAGRSNVGKSSLLNALTGRKALARTSNTPGRTRELNYFCVGDVLHMVDMPGYGYAKAPKAQVKGWNQLIYDYLRGRAQLKRVFLLIDARHGIKNTDQDVLALMDEAAVSYQIVLTKVDKISAAQLDRVQAETAAELAKHAAAHPEIIATSAEKRLGIDELRAAIVGILAADDV